MHLDGQTSGMEPIRPPHDHGAALVSGRRRGVGRGLRALAPSLGSATYAAWAGFNASVLGPAPSRVTRSTTIPFLAVMAGAERAGRVSAGCAAATCLFLAACSPSPEKPSPHPSASPSATLILPTATPLPSPTPPPPPIPPGSVPPGFTPNSVTFVSLETGWALGGAPCGGGTCLALLRTTDAGRHWSAVGSPPTSYSASSGPDHGVSEVRFADPNNGWVFGPELWSTHDGGAHWSMSTLMGVWTLEAADRRVHAVAFGTDGNFTIESSATSRDAWTPTGSLQLGAGPVPSADLVLERNTGWVVENDRTVVDGARLVSGQWTRWNPPCATTGGSAAIGASTTLSLVAVCEEGIWGPSGYPGPPATRAYFSSNGGATWYHGGTLPGVASDSGGVVASPSPGVAVTEVVTATRGELLETFNSGVSWRVVASTSGGMFMAFSYVGFTSPSQGVAIETGEQPAVMLMTFDGGRNWSPVLF